MKRLTFFLCSAIFLLSLTVAETKGQTLSSISFGYDNNGNRTSRTLTYVPMQQGSLSFPVESPEMMTRNSPIGSGDKADDAGVKGEENAKAIDDLDSDSELKVNLFPNPTKGLLRTEITNMPVNARTEARIYDLQGNEHILLKDIDRTTDIDMSSLPDGVYILQIRINTKILNWKIIKNE